MRIHHLTSESLQALSLSQKISSYKSYTSRCTLTSLAQRAVLKVTKNSYSSHTKTAAFAVFLKLEQLLRSTNSHVTVPTITQQHEQPCYGTNSSTAAQRLRCKAQTGIVYPVHKHCWALTKPYSTSNSTTTEQYHYDTHPHKSKEVMTHL